MTEPLTIRVDSSRAACHGYDPSRITVALCRTCPERWTCLEVGLRLTLAAPAEHDFLKFGGFGPVPRRRLLDENGGDPVMAVVAAWRSEGEPVVPCDERRPMEPVAVAPADQATVPDFHPWQPTVIGTGDPRALRTVRRRRAIVGTPLAG